MKSIDEVIEMCEKILMSAGLDPEDTESTIGLCRHYLLKIRNAEFGMRNDSEDRWKRIREAYEFLEDLNHNPDICWACDECGGLYDENCGLVKAIELLKELAGSKPV